jgi:hypothetical protein
MLGGKSDKPKFMRYLKDIIGYYFYHFVEQKIFVSKHATFLKKEFLQKKSNERKIKLEEVQES